MRVDPGWLDTGSGHWEEDAGNQTIARQYAKFTQTEDELQQYRRARLRDWLKASGGAKRVCERRSQSKSMESQISQVLNGYSFGPRAARTMEQKLGMDPGYLDDTGLVEPSGFSPEALRIAQWFDRTDAVERSMADGLRMETSDERRKRRLASLSGKHGGVRAVAQRSGVAWATLDQVLKGTLLPAKEDGTPSPRALGDANVRAIEDAFQLGRGWFDWPFDDVDFKAYAALPESKKAHAQARMAAVIENEVSRADPDLTPAALRIARWFDRLTDPMDRAMAETGSMSVILAILQKQGPPPEHKF